MKFSTCFFLFILSAFAPIVWGDQPQDLEILPRNDLEPENAEVETGSEPDINIIERDNATFEEYRINGRLYKIKVTPKIGTPYYLNYEEGANVWHRDDGVDPAPEAPVWDLMEF